MRERKEVDGEKPRRREREGEREGEIEQGSKTRERGTNRERE